MNKLEYDKNKELEELQEMCSKIMCIWSMRDNSTINYAKHDDDEIKKMFIPSILLRKFEVFKIDIVLPDPLLLLLDICSCSNPGLVQLILMDILENIKTRQGSIPKGYVIKPQDFALTFPMQFPIIMIPEVCEKYNKKWDNEVKTKECNLCDTPEWWLKVME